MRHEVVNHQARQRKFVKRTHGGSCLGRMSASGTRLQVFRGKLDPGISDMVTSHEIFEQYVVEFLALESAMQIH